MTYSTLFVKSRHEPNNVGFKRRAFLKCSWYTRLPNGQLFLWNLKEEDTASLFKVTALSLSNTYTFILLLLPRFPLLAIQPNQGNVPSIKPIPTKTQIPDFIDNYKSVRFIKLKEIRRSCEKPVKTNSIILK